MTYSWDFASILENWPLFWSGIKGTLRLFIVTLVLGLAGGLLIGLLRYSHNRLARWPATTFIEVFRNTPVLVQIIWFYYAMPILTGLEVSTFLAAALGISLNTMAFSAEIYRAGIQSIEPGQWEAGTALGMRRRQTMRRIILPVALKRVIPPLTNRGIEVFKMSTLASVIGYVELLNQGRLISDLNFNPIESFTSVALIFFIVLYPILQFTYVLERRLRRGD